VDNFVLVLPHSIADNSGSTSINTSTGTAAFKTRVLSWVNHSLVHNVTLLQMPHALIGVAETWNLILTSFAAPWYAICSYDITFRPGQLEAFSRRFWTESGLLHHGNRKATVNFAHTKVRYIMHVG
jgi:hypothetical protein